MIAATLLLFLTVTLGVMVAGFWSDPKRRTVDRRSHRLGLTHVALGSLAVAAWVIYLVARDAAAGSVAVTLVLATAAVGVSVLLSTRQGDRTAAYTNRPAPVPAGALVLHGVAAAATIVSTIVAFG